MLRSALLLLLLLTLTACNGPEEAAYAPQFGSAPAGAPPEYVFGVHPLHNPQRLHAIYGPLTDYLNARISGVRFVLEASRDYAEYDRKLYAGHFHLALPNPYQTVTALRHGYRVFGKMGDDEKFRGIILVRRDGPVRDIGDLVGHAISFPAPTALAAAMMPQYFLVTHGIDIHRDVDLRYVGSQESSIMNVYLGLTAAGATWPPPWEAFQQEEPAKAASLEVRWQTPPLPNNGLVARSDLPAELVERVGELLFTLQDSGEGRAILARMPLSRFEPASDATYAPVRAFLEDFSKTVRPLPGY